MQLSGIRPISAAYMQPSGTVITFTAYTQPSDTSPIFTAYATTTTLTKTEPIPTVRIIINAATSIDFPLAMTTICIGYTLTPL